MAFRFSLHRLRSDILRSTTATTSTATTARLFHANAPILTTAIKNANPILSDLPTTISALRFFSTARRNATRSNKPMDIGARARQLQTRRLWTYALTFSCIAGFIVIVLNNFQDQLVFYITPTDAMQKYKENPSRNKFRLGGLVVEGSVAQPSNSQEMEFVITDLITDILVRYQGSLPDLFREGHSVVVEGFVKPLTDDLKKDFGNFEASVSGKAKSGDCYFKATEVLAKHDEKYMPKEVADAIEKNKKLIEEASSASQGAQVPLQAAIESK